MSKLDLSVVIANRNGAKVLSSCLDSLRRSQRISLEVIVVDDASMDGSRELVARGYPEVRLVELPQNLGFGAASNRGAAISAGRYILFLNNDTIVHKGALEDLVTFADSHPELRIGALGLILRDGSGKAIHSFGSFPSPFRQFQLWTARFFGGYEAILRRRAIRLRLSHFPVDYITGAALLVPRAVLKRVGGFDEGFFLYFEDTELQSRMARTGYGRYVLRGPRIVHFGADGRARSNAVRIITYKSLLRYHRLTMTSSRFNLYRFLFLGLAMLHLANRAFRFRENVDFIAACFREVQYCTEL
jgi:hypothetical protein